MHPSPARPRRASPSICGRAPGSDVFLTGRCCGTWRPRMTQTVAERRCRSVARRHAVDERVPRGAITDIGGVMSCPWSVLPMLLPMVLVSDTTRAASAAVDAPDAIYADGFEFLSSSFFVAPGG